MARPEPEYNFDDFLEACKKNRSQVKFESRVKMTAARDFSLFTQEEILNFIAIGGLENLEFQNSKIYQVSQEIPPPKCDAYTFKSGISEGYISFFYNFQQDTWVIKSFHRDNADEPTMLELALIKAGLSPEIFKMRKEI